MVQALSQDDSFFDNVIETVSEKDMFEESDSEVENIVIISDVSSVESKLDKTEIESQGSSLSLPSSVLDIRAKALEEIQNKPARTRKKCPQSENESQVSRVVADKVDLGPFFGLPTRVRELYVEYKGVTSLFLWQEKCLKSAAVKNKSNFLYSLPTSGGNTLVAESLIKKSSEFNINIDEKSSCGWTAQGLLENGQDTDRQNFYFLYLTENENLALISFEDL